MQFVVEYSWRTGITTRKNISSKTMFSPLPSIPTTDVDARGRSLIYNSPENSSRGCNESLLRERINNNEIAGEFLQLRFILYIYRVFRKLWDPLRELIVRLKIVKRSHINICPICLRLWDIINFINRANSSKLVLPGMVYSIFIIIIIGMKKTHMLLCIQHINTSLV